MVVEIIEVFMRILRYFEGILICLGGAPRCWHVEKDEHMYKGFKCDLLLKNLSRVKLVEYLKKSMICFC